jgi:hypothetical protein
MPVDGSEDALVTFRSYRDLYQDVEEKFFRISAEERKRTFRAVVVRPQGKSLQQQLLDLHRAHPAAGVDEVRRKLRFDRSEFSEAQCPELRTQMNALSQLSIQMPTRDLIVLHPVVYRIVINFGGGSLDATFVEEENPLVQWARLTTRTLATCVERRQH